MSKQKTISQALGEDGLSALRRYIATDQPGMSDVDAVAFLVRDALIGLGELPLGAKNRSRHAGR